MHNSRWSWLPFLPFNLFFFIFILVLPLSVHLGPQHSPNSNRSRLPNIYIYFYNNNKKKEKKKSKYRKDNEETCKPGPIRPEILLLELRQTKLYRLVQVQVVKGKKNGLWVQCRGEVGARPLKCMSGRWNDYHLDTSSSTF